jgi:23S rRNA (guanine745-N1)-methyltransferase
MPVASPLALDLFLPMLRCPVCGAPLLRATAALRCPARHSFVSRTGIDGDRVSSFALS